MIFEYLIKTTFLGETLTFHSILSILGHFPCLTPDGFISYVFKHRNLCYYNVSSAINPIQCLYHLKYCSFLFLNFFMTLFPFLKLLYDPFMSSMFALNILNMWNVVRITV